MAANDEFLNDHTTNAWLSQFNSEDQRIAALILKSLALINRDEFAENLVNLIRSRASDQYRRQNGLIDVPSSKLSSKFLTS